MKAALGHLALSMLPKYSQGKRLQIYCFSKRNITGKKTSSQNFEPLFHVADFYPTFSALVKQVT